MTKQIKNILDEYPEFKANIGIEIHTQLKTNSKIFCSCQNRFGDRPNENICQICSGYPGVLPSLNKKVIDFAIMTGLATNCKITQISSFARKHYIYPDLPKNYQITQFDKPICTQGYVNISLPDKSEKKIRLTRIHIEEDAGKIIHGEKESYVDLNRAGTPLLEIVSYPDIQNSLEAKLYLTNLKNIIQYLEISNANMEEGSFRGDVNISVRLKDQKELGTKVELKNINSFKFIAQAIDYEIERQIKEIKSGNKIFQETRLWDAKQHKSFVMRSKEEAEDYEYLTEPDLPLIIIDENWLEKIKKQVPELPYNKIKRFEKEYNISFYEANILTSNKLLANFFEDTVKICNKPKKTSNWILRNLLGYLKENKISLDKSKISAQNLAELITEIENGTINSKVAQEVFEEMAQKGISPIKIIKENELQQIENIDELEKIVIQILKDNPNEVEKYLSGKDRLLSFFVGQAMKSTKGKANPKIIQKLLNTHLKK